MLANTEKKKNLFASLTENNGHKSCWDYGYFPPAH